MQVARWGNSLAIRVPASVVRILDLKEGDEVEVAAAGERSLAIAKREDREAMLARLDEFRGRLPAGWKFDRDELYRPGFDEG